MRSSKSFYTRPTFTMSGRANCCASWLKYKPKIRAQRSGLKCNNRHERKATMKAKSKAAYMISAVAERYQIHPQTLRLYEREGLLAPSRSEGNTRLYTDDDLERLEVILKLTRELGVNLAGVEIILNMREKMEAMQAQIEGFIETLNQELSQRAAASSNRQANNNSLMPVIQINAITYARPDKRSYGESKRRGR